MKNTNQNGDSMSSKFIQSASADYVKLGTSCPYYELLAAAYALKHPVDSCNVIVKKYAETFRSTVKNNSQNDWDKLLSSICDNPDELVHCLNHTTDRRIVERTGLLYDKDLACYITSLLSEKSDSDDDIYFPACNLSLISLFSPTDRFDCFDANEENVVFSRVIHELAGNTNATFNVSDSKQPIDKNQLASHNRIFVIPKYSPLDNNYSTENIILSIVENWQPNSRVVILCPSSFLLIIKHHKLRQSLISNNYVRKVVSLPTGEFSSVGVHLCLVVLDNTDVSEHSIQFVDYSKNNSLSDIKYVESENEYSVWFDINEVEESNLLPSFYHNKVSVAKEVGNLVNPTPLSKLVDLVRRDSEVSSPVRIITAKNLYEKKKLEYKDFSFIEPSMSTERVPRLAKLDCDCILLNRISAGYLNPVIFHHTPGQEYYVNHSLFAYKTISNAVSLEYIASELTKEYVKRQFFQPSLCITPHSLLSIVIEMPLTQEEQLTSIIKSQSDALYDVTKELIKLKEKEHNDYVLNLRARKHRISHTIGEVKNSMDIIDLLLESNKGVINVNDLIGDSQLSVGDILDNLRTNLVKTIKQISTLVDSKRYGEPAEYDIAELVSEFMSIPHSHLHTFNNCDEICDEQLKNCRMMVSVNKDDLFSVFKEVVNNAIKYGFDNTPHIINGEETNAINFFVTLCEVTGEQYVNIIISNNGNPLPEKMTPDRVFTWGECSESGSGIGGWDIKNTIEHYGGFVSINEESDAIYDFYDCPVRYSIKLPITTIISKDYD